MSWDSRHTPSEISLDSRITIVQVCRMFERAWQETGESPDLRTFVNVIRPERRLALLEELLQLDWCYRLGAGERPTLDRYEAQFPELRPLRDELADVVGELSAAELGGPAAAQPFSEKDESIDDTSVSYDSADRTADDEVFASAKPEIASVAASVPAAARQGEMLATKSSLPTAAILAAANVAAGAGQALCVPPERPFRDWLRGAAIVALVTVAVLFTATLAAAVMSLASGRN